MEEQNVINQFQQVYDQLDETGKQDIQNILTRMSHRIESPMLQNIYPFNMSFDLENKTGTVDFEINQFMLNTINILHGGISMLTADMLMGTLCNKLVPDGKRVVTQEMNTYFIGKGDGSRITGTSNIIKWGQNSIIAECRLYNDDKPIIHATGSFFIIDMPEN